MKKLNIGKLETEDLKRLVLDKIINNRKEIKIGAGIGEDCATISFGDFDCVVSTDPITSSVKDIGRLAVHISCNDIASDGVEPVAIMLAVMLPEGTTDEDVSEIMDQAVKAADEAGVQIAGGHTEITRAVNQPVIVSTAIGKTISGESQNAREMKPGDDILITKTAGIEGTGIICGDLKYELEGVLSSDELNHGKSLLNDVSVVRDGNIAAAVGTSGMHDVTEGGILGALWEVCSISGLGAIVEEDKIPVDPVTSKIAKHYSLDPMRLISSGCMLITARKEKSAEIIGKMAKAGILCSRIGEVKDNSFGLKLKKCSGETEEIGMPGTDELYKAISRG